MKVLRTICRRCNKEVIKREDIKNLNAYTEDLKYNLCPECKKLYGNDPEEKLLRAIFGEKED